jgi:hypothetical protein
MRSPVYKTHQKVVRSPVSHHQLLLPTLIPVDTSGSPQANTPYRNPQDKLAMSGLAPKLTFVEKMMAKMGHVPGRGLGKSGEGIAEQIGASGTQECHGIGFERSLAPAGPARTSPTRAVATPSYHAAPF